VDPANSRELPSPALTLAELERIRDDVHRAIERTRAQIDRIEVLILAVQLRTMNAAALPPSILSAGSPPAVDHAQPRVANDLRTN
jgi:hypothetical protein